MIAPHPEDRTISALVAALGPARVGKTSLLEQFTLGIARENCCPTLKRRSLRCTVVLSDRIYELECADVPAMNGFPRNPFEEWEICPGFGIRTANAYMLVYDVSRPATFQVIANIFEQLRKFRPNAPVVVVGAKCDLNPRQDSAKAIATLVRKHWKCPYMECSAKYNWRVTAVFQELMTLIEHNADFVVRKGVVYEARRRMPERQKRCCIM